MRKRSGARTDPALGRSREREARPWPPRMEGEMPAPAGGGRGWALRALREVMTEIERKVDDPAVSDADFRRWLRGVAAQARATQDRWRRAA